MAGEMTVNTNANVAVSSDRKIMQEKKEEIRPVSVYSEDTKTTNNETNDIFKYGLFGAYFGAVPGLAYLSLQSIAKDEVISNIEKINNAIDKGVKTVFKTKGEAKFHHLRHLKNYKKLMTKAGRVAIVGTIIGATIGIVASCIENNN